MVRAFLESAELHPPLPCYLLPCARSSSCAPRALPPPSPALSPSSQAEDPVDAKPAIDKACHPACLKAWGEYEKCQARIAAKGAGTCEPWAFDYWKCIDKCVSAATHPAFSRRGRSGPEQAVGWVWRAGLHMQMVARGALLSRRGHFVRRATCFAWA